MVEACLVNPRRRGPPADMLLLAARVKRKSVFADERVTEDILTSDDDELVESEASAPSRAAFGGAVLWRSIEDVHLGHIGWSGPIDHHSLQVALACSPADDASRAFTSRLFPRTYDVVGTPRSLQGSAVALEVTLSSADLSLCDAIGTGEFKSALPRILDALCLPERITGATVPTQHALNSVLAAYRHSSLACAWQLRPGANLDQQLRRERDEAAVTLLSTLRAVLGER